MEYNTPLYNSRIVRNYTEYLARYRQDIDIDALLNLSGISVPELNDHGHWFSQSQIDRFHEVIDRKANDPELSRKVGQYYASSEGLGAARQYILGLLNVPTGYRLMGKIYSMFSRTMVFQSKNQKKNYIELVFTPKHDVTEKVFQCQNRLGAIESLAQLFTGKQPEVDHPYCIHKGDGYCQYNVTWQSSRIARLKNILHYSLPVFIAAGCGAFFLLPFFSWLSVLLGGGICYTFAELVITESEKRRNQKILLSQGDTEEMLLNETKARFDNALLIQNIGKAASAMLKEKHLIREVTQMMRSHLDFDRGVIFLLETRKHALVPEAIYGYSDPDSARLFENRIHLDDEKAEGVLLKAFKTQKTQLIGPQKKPIQEMGLVPGPKELICAPIVFDGASLGVIVVDNLKTKRPLTQTDEHLINGIAAQIGVSIVNARAYVKIAESENRYRLIADNAADAIWLMNARTLKFTYMSPAIERILGYRPEDFTGRACDLTIRGAHYQQLQSVLSTLLEQPAAEPSENQAHILTVEQKHRNGHTVWTEITVKPLEMPDTQHTILGITRDISERVHAERQKQQLEDQLRIARKMETIGKFAGGIAHDFNNILNVVVLNAEMGRDGEDDDMEGKDYSFNQILDSGKRARDLIRQLLVFTKGQPENHKALCIANTVRDTLKMVRSMIPAEITLSPHIPRQQMLIYADPTQIQQVIINLCVNAAQSMDIPGRGRLDVILEAVDGDVQATKSPSLSGGSAGWVKLSIKDTGCGIDKANLDKIFNPFFTTKNETNGTGLGLSIVNEIIANHNGSIDVESTPGKGTTFHILLPRIHKRDAALDEQATQGRPLPVLKGTEHILLVDDESPVLKATEKLLKNLGYTVTAVNDSRTALTLFSGSPHEFDAVVSDMTMPHLTGLDLCERIKSLRKDIPLIICTGHSDQLSPEQATQAGIVYIAKPFKIREIAAAIRHSIDPPGKQPDDS